MTRSDQQLSKQYRFYLGAPAIERKAMSARGVLPLFLLSWLVGVLHVNAFTDSMWGDSAKIPVPEGAKVTLEFDHQEYFLGENILIHFTLENTGSEPFEYDWGGDYRGASRHLRFKVTATDDAGNVAEDPDPSPICFGGLGGTHTIKPGEKFIQSLPLMRYCRIVQHGRYTILASHDFGWKEGDRKRPAGKTTITLHMPDVVEAERVVTQMEALPTDSNMSYGQRSRDFADFSCLYQPIYLEPLAHRARTGDLRVLAGLNNMATTKATEVLIDLAGEAAPTLALEAALTLNRRLPDPEFEKKLPGRGPFRFDALESRRRLAATAWDEKFVLPVRALAVKILAMKEAREIGCGAFMIQAVGTTAEAGAVLGALDRVIEPMVNPRHDPKDNILNFPEPLPELLRAMQSLHSRGFSLGESMLRDGQVLLYFEWLEDEPLPRPPRWQQMLDAFGRSGCYPLREAALRSIPQPMPQACVKVVEDGLGDSDYGVCRAACSVAGKSGRQEFLKPLLEILATKHHPWLLREASETARSLGAGFDLLEVWANRLDEETLYPLALDNLQMVLEGLPGGSSGRTDLTPAERLELRKQWNEFLAIYADEIRRGKRFKLTDTAVKPELFGRARTWQLPDGTSWPKPLEAPVLNGAASKPSRVGRGGEQ